jgi:hypothetical protein
MHHSAETNLDDLLWIKRRGAARRPMLKASYMTRCPPHGPGAPARQWARHARKSRTFEMATQEGGISQRCGDVHHRSCGQRPQYCRSDRADVVERFLAGEVLPFFAPYKELARSVSCLSRAQPMRGFVQ